MSFYQFQQFISVLFGLDYIKKILIHKDKYLNKKFLKDTLEHFNPKLNH